MNEEYFDKIINSLNAIMAKAIEDDVESYIGRNVKVEKLGEQWVIDEISEYLDYNDTTHRLREFIKEVIIMKVQASALESIARNKSANTAINGESI